MNFKLNFWIHDFTWKQWKRKGQICLRSTTLVCLYISVALISISQAEDLYITDDYLRGLSDEASNPEYLEKAKQELLKTEKLEQSQTFTASDIRKALISMYNFETLISTKYPSSYFVYSKLPASARILIFDEFRRTKKLSVAERMIIEKYEIK